MVAVEGVCVCMCVCVLDRTPVASLMCVWGVCVCVHMCVWVCGCNFTFLCPSNFRNTLKYQTSPFTLRLRVREYVEAKQQIFGLVNIFVSQTVLALPKGILQAFATLIH